jgi:4-hydroxybenzoate polyprenyltransferase
MVVQRATSQRAEPYGVVALLAGILAAYSLDRVVDRTTPAGRQSLEWILMAVAVGATFVCAAAASQLPVHTAALIPLLGLTSLLYSGLKRHAVVKAVVLPAIWIWAALALPFNDGSWFGWHALLRPVTAPLLLLNTAACLLCDLKDETRDRRTGVRSLPAIYGGAITIRVAIALAVVAAGLALVEHRAGLVFSAAALGAAATTPSLLAVDVVGPLMVDVILTIPGILISAHVV